MRVHVGADHAAFECKNALVSHLRERGHEVVDHGPHDYDPDDDYPHFVLPAARAVADDPEAFGLVLGGSGNGEQIAANKVRGVRAVLAYDVETARLGREHNDARIVSIGARMTTPELATEILDVFLATPFSHDDRHARRIALIDAYEGSGRLPADDG